MTPEALRRLGLDGLGQLRTEYGFSASDPESGLYPALYGRDSLWTLLLLLAAVGLRDDEEVVALAAGAGPDILRALAALQGREVDDRVEEQPGKIPHEHHPVPSPHALDMELPLAAGRSYAGFDETFLFVLAYEAFVAFRPSDPVVADLASNVERARTWIVKYADEDGDGLYEYRRRNPANLLNQVWKDSFDAATHTGFDVPPHPVAWIDVQAYAYAVFPNDAATLAQAVDEQFWLGDDAGFAMAVDAAKRPIRMASSNPGHALWTGAVLDARVGPLVARLMAPDLLSPYGVRTLSSRSPFYAPFAYHRGGVWPHDNAILALGLVRYGRVEEAARVAAAVSDGIAKFGSAVECYAVLDRDVVVDPPAPRPPLCWRTWPARNRTQAFSAAGLVALAAILDRFG